VRRVDVQVDEEEEEESIEETLRFSTSSCRMFSSFSI
jgi:hypothetical protein